MAEYIEREAAFNAILKLVPKVDDDGYCWVIRGDAAMAIDSIPAADVVPVRHGRWERKADPYGFFDTISVCSVCDCTTKWREEYLYCPNCGARMDGDGDV